MVSREVKMALSEDDKARIREEEEYRAQVRNDLQKKSAPIKVETRQDRIDKIGINIGIFIMVPIGLIFFFFFFNSWFG